LGKRFVDVMQSPEGFAKVPKFSLYLWIANLLSAFCVAPVKLSIIALYWKLFGVDQKSKLPLLTMGGIIVSWFFALVSSIGPMRCTLLIEFRRQE
jgi:hypothetical protein